MADSIRVADPLEKLLRIFQREKHDIYRIYLYAILGGLINLSLPLGIQSIINFIQSGQVSTSWIVLVAFVMLGLVIGGVLQIFQMYMIDKIAQRLFANASFEIAWKLPRLRLSSIDNVHITERINRFFDVISLQKGVSKILMEFTAALLQVIFGLILLSLYHPLFIGFSFFIVLFMAVVYWFTIPRGLHTNLQESKYKYKMVYWLEEVAESLVSFKLAGSTRLHLDRTDHHVSNYVAARHEHFRILALQYAFSVVLKILIAGGLLIAGSLLVLNNQMNLGQFVAAEIIILLISSSIDKLIIGLETVYDVLVAVEKIDQLTGLETDDEPEQSIAMPHHPQGIGVSFSEVSLTYPDRPEAVLKQVSAEIAAGERVVIAGWDGPAASALLQVASGNFPVQQGAVMLNGIPLVNLLPETYRDVTGNFLNMETIFHGTIEENITIGRPHVTFAHVEKALERVGLIDWVRKQPFGFRTELTPDGHMLYADVRTKLLMARAIAGEPGLLLLEFPVLHLTEADCSAFRHFLLDRTIPWTVLAVSNSRLLADHADRILIFKDGVLFASGSPKTLSKEAWYGTVFHS